MVSGKMKLLSAAIGIASLIASPALARTVHNAAPPADHDQSYDQTYSANNVVVNGKLIGTARNPSIRSQMQLDGLPE
jgi:hypothetical protein